MIRNIAAKAKVLLSQNAGEIFMKLMICLALMAGVVGGCSLLNKKIGLADDHVIEELIESHIQENTGLNLDLTPDSEE